MDCVCLETHDPIEQAEAQIASGHAHEAARALRDRLAVGRGGTLARVTLVKALLASNDVPGALAEAREAVSLNPDVPAVLVALGRALLAAENLPAAISELQRALRADPDMREARLLTAQAWLKAGEADKALEMLEALDADSETGSMIALAEAIRRATRSDPGYVRHLFDQFAGDYDARMLGPLRYAAPQILWDLAHLVMGARSGLTVLDLGCGTGLAGAQFCGLAERLDGVDLSPGMLEKARARGLYDTLALADLETALATPAPLGLVQAYDLILAADTLVYLGDLETVFRNAAARLVPDGYFLFTVEAYAGEGFSLGPKRRWRHAETYLRATAAAAGLTVAGLVAAAPRSEANQPVQGFAVALTGS